MTTAPTWRVYSPGVWAGYGMAVDFAPYLSASGIAPALISDAEAGVFAHDPDAWQRAYISASGFVPSLVIDYEFNIYGGDR